MSIYPVDFKNDQFWKKTLPSSMKELIEESECIVCQKRMSEGKEMWAYHALPYVGWGQWWCSEECMEGTNNRK